MCYSCPMEAFYSSPNKTRICSKFPVISSYFFWCINIGTNWMNELRTLSERLVVLCSNKVTQLSDAERVLFRNISGETATVWKASLDLFLGPDWTHIYPCNKLSAVNIIFRYSHIVIISEDKCRVFEAWWRNVQKCRDVKNGKWTVVRRSEVKWSEVKWNDYLGWNVCIIIYLYLCSSV